MERIISIIVLITCMFPHIAVSQSKFYSEFALECGLSHLKIKDGGQEVDIRSYNPDKSPKWLAKIGSKDYSAELYMSSKFGWDFAYTPFSVYGNLKFSYRRFFSKFPDDETYTRNKLWYILPGFGVRLSIKDMLRHYGHCPIFQVGIDYGGLAHYNGIYGKQKKQLAKGVNTIYGLGWTLFYGYTTVLVEIELPHHDIFNTAFTPDNGTSYPFSNVESKMYTIQLQCLVRID